MYLMSTIARGLQLGGGPTLLYVFYFRTKPSFIAFGDFNNLKHIFTTRYNGN